MLILGSVLGLLTGRNTYAWIVGGRGDLGVSPLTLGLSSSHSEGQFSEKCGDERILYVVLSLLHQHVAQRLQHFSF